ncbi:MAG: flavin reductase family protein [Elusimicrobiota bacterium]
MDIEPRTLSPRERYGLLIHSILPRPIAWISTMSPDGLPNLAPFSFFTGIAAEPMSVCFSPVNNRLGVEKDTLINIRKTGEFTVNIVTETAAEMMNKTSAEYPYGVSEFEKAGVTPLKGVKVAPHRVKESPVHMECRVLRIVTLSSGPLGGHVVVGEIVFFHADDSVWKNGGLSHHDLRAIGRMGGSWYARTSDAFEMPRPNDTR